MIKLEMDARGLNIIMNKWELARYLIDAKKCVDSIMYIEKNIELLKNINVREKVNAKRRDFYTNCCIVLEKTFPTKKKELCATDNIIQRLYYERDKNIAHKDSDYKATLYNSLADMISDLQNQISHLKELCKEMLPSAISLDFVPYDRELFRLINGLTAEKEILIEREKYPLKNRQTTYEKGKTYKVFHDTEELRDIDNSDVDSFATIVENGTNIYEGLQNRQDFCIKSNVLYGQDMWSTVNLKLIKIIEELENIGIIDKFNIFHIELLSNSDIQKEFAKIIEAAENERTYREPQSNIDTSPFD